MLLLLLILPLAAAAVVATFGWTRVTSWCCVADAAAIGGGAVWLALRVANGATLHAPHGVLRADALSGFMVLLVATLTLLATSSAVGYVRAELDHDHTNPAAARWFGALMMVFVATMLFALLAANVAVMWIAIESTTVVTAFLVGHRRTRASLEASWKYVIIGSVGIVLAFLGTILLALAARHAGLSSAHSLDWEALAAPHGGFDPGVVKLGAALLVLGFGTKVGLAPMHTWLPDAHSQAPAPVSALMSGVLLSVAFYAVLRWKVVIDGASAPISSASCWAAPVSCRSLSPPSMLIAQRDYKRTARLLEHRTHGAHRRRRVHRHPPRDRRAVVTRPRARSRQRRRVRLLGRDPPPRRHHRHRVRAWPPRPQPAPGRHLRRCRSVALLGMPPFGLFASEIAIARRRLQRGHGLAHQRCVRDLGRRRRRGHHPRATHAARADTRRTSAARIRPAHACR